MHWLLFWTKSERARRQRRRQRRAFLQADQAIASVAERIKELDSEARKAWERAREATKAGEHAAAQRALISYRAAQVHITKLNQKRWVFDLYYAQMQTAHSDQLFSQALECITRVLRVDPEHVADVFTATRQMLQEQEDTERLWRQRYEREAETMGAALEDHIPSLEDLTRQVEQEAAAEISEGARAAQAELDQHLHAQEQRLNDILDKK